VRSHREDDERMPNRGWTYKKSPAGRAFALRDRDDGRVSDRYVAGGTISPTNAAIGEAIEAEYLHRPNSDRPGHQNGGQKVVRVSVDIQSETTKSDDHTTKLISN
jgi:hypothetical protein